MAYDEPVTATDYLGQRSPVSLSGKPALPVGGPPAAASAGPVLPAGAGVAVPGGGIEGGAATATGGQGAYPVSSSPGVLSQLAGGAKLANFVNKFLPSSPTGSFELSPETQAAWDAFRAGERADLGSLSGFGNFETLGQVSGGELGLGAEGADLAGEAAGLAGTAGEVASFGAGVAPSFGALSSALGAAGPYWAGLTAAVDFLGEGKLPGEDILNMIFGFNNPSKGWTSFPGRVQDTLKATESANQTLAQALATADTASIPQALAAWRSAIGQHVGGFESRGGPLEIPDLPGAGYGQHEGGGRLTADFSPEVTGLREMLSAAMAGATPEDRIAALMRGLESRRAALGAERESRDAEWRRIYGTPEEQSQAALMSAAGGGGGGGGDGSE